MLDILEKDWGSFDLVTAFCSLYYLETEDMVRVASAARRIAPCFVVQANETTRTHAADKKAEKSSVPFLEDLLRRVGFETVEVRNRGAFGRPISAGFGSDGAGLGHVCAEFLG